MTWAQALVQVIDLGDPRDMALLLERMELLGALECVNEELPSGTKPLVWLLLKYQREARCRQRNTIVKGVDGSPKLMTKQAIQRVMIGLLLNAGAEWPRHQNVEKILERAAPMAFHRRLQTA